MKSDPSPLQQLETQHVSSDNSNLPGPHWRIWSCIETLLADVESNPMMAEPYRSTTLQVASILRHWGYSWAGDLSWASFLNKRQIHHEAEESIVAIYHFNEWRKKQKKKMTTKTCFSNNKGESCSNNTTDKIIAVDVCGGKGFFSMLVSYMASEFWLKQKQEKQEHQSGGGENVNDLGCCVLDKIILLEKADIDWKHIHAANARDGEQPLIEIWAKENLHLYDKLLPKFRSLSQNNNDALIAFTGIHLCKMLSPSLISLANGLGSPYLLLAPCCLPRVVLGAKKQKQKKKKEEGTTTPAAIIPIYLFESQQQQEQRLEHNRRKLMARNNHACYYCKKKNHWVKQCPDVQSLNSIEEQDRIVNAAMASIPCWYCGLVGHKRTACPTPNSKITTRYPPTIEMNVSHVIESSTPFEDYCKVLARHIHIGGGGEGGGMFCHPVTSTTTTTTTTTTSTATGNDSDEKNTINNERSPKVKKLKSMSPDNKNHVQIIEAGLTGNKSGHDDGNWNSRRKSIFLVATR